MRARTHLSVDFQLFGDLYTLRINSKKYDDVWMIEAVRDVVVCRAWAAEAIYLDDSK